MTAERLRLEATREQNIPWKKWGPYLSERQWGTVREDYSENGDAWNFFTHDHARSRAYRWGEDGLAGISDDQQQLCFALALWNGKDAILKERLFGMLWSKQFFFFDRDNWLDEHHSNPLHSGYRNSRNSEWFHMLNKDIISMPDKWEYPWYAAWDLAFQTLPLAIVDPDFAKEQMKLMLKGVYLHPSGQLPAYEWNFSDVNPPVHSFATSFLHRTEQALGVESGIEFIKEAFNKLLLNFTWWANRKDRFGKNVFEGDFLGLDNIGVFDCSAPRPTGGHLEQADGTAWMALFSQNMAELAIELSVHDPTQEEMVVKFVEQFYYIASAMNRSGDDGMWDEADGFYHDLLRLPLNLEVSRTAPVCLQRAGSGVPVGLSAGRVEHRDVRRRFQLARAALDAGNVMILGALLNFYLYYGENFKIECPSGSGKLMNLFEVSQEIANRLMGIFLRGERGRRAVYDDTEKFQTDPHWRDQILFYEYFHGDNGAGLGASHQTGWTGLVAKIIQLYGSLDAKQALAGGKMTGFQKSGSRSHESAILPCTVSDQHPRLADRAVWSTGQTRDAG